MNDLDRQIRSYYDEAVQRVDPSSPGDLQPETPSRPTPRWVVAFGAAAAALIAGVVTITLVGTSADDSAESMTTPAPASSVTPTEPTAPTAAIEPPILWGPVRLETLGDSMLAWNGTEAWRYSGGAWSRDTTGPTGMSDVALTGDTLWALSGVGAIDGAFLEYLGASEWWRLEAAPPAAWRIAADPGSSTLWVSTGYDLYRWDGSKMTNVGHPPNWGNDGEAGDGHVGDIAVTSDGAVWAAGLYGYAPSIGALSRYDDDLGSWELVLPLGGSSTVPATLLAPTPDGGLWVVLADWSEDWEPRDAGEPPGVLTLARYDGATGEWLVHGEVPSGGYPEVMASDGDTVWLARNGNVVGFDRVGGISRFDGRTWTTYLEDTPVDDTFDDIAVAPDGTIWYTINGEIHQLVP